MEDGDFTLSHAVARTAVRLEVLEQLVVLLVRAFGEDCDEVIAALETWSGPGYATIDGQPVALTPEHRQAAIDAARALAERIRLSEH